jgi:hypothetical protein
MKRPRFTEEQIPGILKEKEAGAETAMFTWETWTTLTDEEASTGFSEFRRRPPHTKEETRESVPCAQRPIIEIREQQKATAILDVYRRRPSDASFDDRAQSKPP